MVSTPPIRSTNHAQPDHAGHACVSHHCHDWEAKREAAAGLFATAQTPVRGLDNTRFLPPWHARSRKIFGSRKLIEGRRKSEVQGQCDARVDLSVCQRT